MKATIDRIEGTMAVLISLDDEAARINLPVSLLPPDCREGDILMIEIERDTSGTRKAKDRISGRIERLKNRK
ncbi:MAG TPA: DUF3006 domain-containing protein [Methanoregula sp.]|nr:DUF3006 domain-containing protein [Methanoregula sp.]